MIWYGCQEERWISLSFLLINLYTLFFLYKIIQKEGKKTVNIENLSHKVSYYHSKTRAKYLSRLSKLYIDSACEAEGDFKNIRMVESYR